MITPWMALVLLDTVTVATFARCFSGPGELAIAIPVCIGAHLLAHLARRVSGSGRHGGGWGLWALTVVLVAFVPVALIDGGSFHWGLPLGATQHLVGHQLQAAWTLFSYRVAPVPQAHGLVLATAWAAGALALAAEALDADTTLPAIVALVPAFDIVVFTGTLGTATGRAPELAALAGLAVWYLAGAPRAAAGEQVVTARVEGAAGHTDGARTLGRGGRHFGAAGGVFSRIPSTVPALVVVAAVAGGVIGPLLPGATSLPLVAWRGSGRGSPNNRGGPTGGGGGPVTINDLVQVGEEEINNSSQPLLRIYGGSEPTREVLAVLDHFNGDQWTPENSGRLRNVPQFSGEMFQLEAHLPPAVKFKNGEFITQVIYDIDLAGDQLPAPGPVSAIDGVDNATIQGADGPVVIAGSMSNGFTYGVRSLWEPSAAVAQEFLNASPPPAGDLKLPTPIPADIVKLAHDLVTSGMTELQKADSIQNFLLSPPFHYVLPKSVPPNQTDSYQALSSFLFSTRAGYCQQFASAFAVLGRIDGLPTRVAVGFLPPDASSHGEWVVTGEDVHAWPQVYFGGTGWIDFEPTPGSGSPSTPNITVPSTVPPTTTVVGPHTGSTPPAHNLRPPPGGVTGSSFAFPTIPTTPTPGGPTPGSGSSGVSDVLLALVAGVLLWVLVVPTWRFVRDRRKREPGRAVLLAWQETITVLAAAGLHRRRAETFQEFSSRVRKSGAVSDDAAAALDRLAETANRALFALRPPTAADAQQARLDSRSVRRSGRRSMAWWAQIIIQLDPRDLLVNV